MKLQQELVKAENATQEADARRRQDIATELQSLQGALDDLDESLLLADQTLKGQNVILVAKPAPRF